MFAFHFSSRQLPRTEPRPDSLLPLPLASLQAVTRPLGGGIYNISIYIIWNCMLQWRVTGISFVKYVILYIIIIIYFGLHSVIIINSDITWPVLGHTKWCALVHYCQYKTISYNFNPIQLWLSNLKYWFEQFWSYKNFFVLILTSKAYGFPRSTNLYLVCLKSISLRRN